MSGARQASSIDLKSKLDEFVEKYFRRKPRFICRGCWAEYSKCAMCPICGRTVVAKEDEYEFIQQAIVAAKVRERNERN